MVIGAALGTVMVICFTACLLALTLLAVAVSLDLISNMVRRSKNDHK